MTPLPLGITLGHGIVAGEVTKIDREPRGAATASKRMRRSGN